MMKLKPVFLTVLFFACLSPLCKAQNTKDTLSKRQERKLERKNRNRYIGGYTGLVNYNYKDYTVSPLLYSGTKLTGSLEYLSIGDKKINSVKFVTASGNLKNKVKDVLESPTKLNHYYLEFYKLYYINSFLKDKWNFYLGYASSLNFDLRTNPKFQNSAFTYNGQLDVAPMMQIDRRFDLNATGKFLRKKPKILRVSWQLSIPALSFIIRPYYNGIRQGMSTEDNALRDLIQDEVFRNVKTNSLNNYFRMTNNITVEYYFKNNNGLKFSYVSDVVNMYKNITGRRLQYSNGGILIGLMFKLDNNSRR